MERTLASICTWRCVSSYFADRAGTLDKFKAAEPTCAQFEEKLARYTKVQS